MGSSHGAAGIQGGTHKSTKFSPYHKGLTAVVDCLLLSKAKYIIKNRSSLSDVALYFMDNPRPRFTFVLLPQKDLVWSFRGDELLGEGAEEAVQAIAGKNHTHHSSSAAAFDE